MSESNAAATIDLDEAIRLFRKLMPPDVMHAQKKPAASVVYTPWIVTWLMVYQSLRGAASLEDAVIEMLEMDPEFLPDNKRVREGTLSANTSGYSRARTRLAVEHAEWATDNITTALIDPSPPAFRDRHAFLIDGSTLTLAATDPLREAFPPTANQHGKSHWPLLRLVKACELSSGTSLRPEIGPMAGSKGVGEVELTFQLLKRLPPYSLLIADRNFGIFAFVWMALMAGHDILVRLTARRFWSLVRQAQPAGPGCWELTWRPSRWDRQSDPSLPADATLELRLHEIRVGAHLTLYLVTSLDEPAEILASLYHKRQDVETDLRDMKITLKMEGIRGQSPEMVRKELAAATIAHNLAVLVRRLGAARAGVEPRRLSFARVLSVTRGLILKTRPGATQAERARRIEQAVRLASQCKLPNRPGRSYPREVITRRTKYPRKGAKKSEAPTK